MFRSSDEERNWKMFKKIDKMSSTGGFRCAMVPKDQIFLDVVEEYRVGARTPEPEVAATSTKQFWNASFPYTAE